MKNRVFQFDYPEPHPVLSKSNETCGENKISASLSAVFFARGLTDGYMPGKNLLPQEENLFTPGRKSPYSKRKSLLPRGEKFAGCRYKVYEMQ